MNMNEHAYNLNTYNLKHFNTSYSDHQTKYRVMAHKIYTSKLQASGRPACGTAVWSNMRKTAGKWQKCNLVSGMASVGQRHGLAMNWVDLPRTSADERDVVCSPRCGDCVWSVAGFGCFFHWPLVFLGLDSCVITYFSSAALLLSLQSFYNYARGHCEAAQASNCSGVCWEEGMGDGGVLVLQDVGTMKSLHWRCEMWLDCVERKRSAKLPWSATAPCTFAAGVLACVSYVHFVCVCA